MTETTSPWGTRLKAIRLPWRDVVITLAALVLAFAVGAVLMIVSDPKVTEKFSYFFARPSDALVACADKVGGAYGALAYGALGSVWNITETTAQAAPLIAAGLGVGLAFRAGLFNIGAQGQAILGAMAGAWIGFALHLPLVLHAALAIGCAMLAGGLWGGVAGWLRAKAGAHEVIVTIMLNYIAGGLLAFALTTSAFMRPGRSDPLSPEVDWSATLMRLAGTRLHVGFALVLVAAVAVWWLVERSTTGFAIRAIGANPHAAATAGMSTARTTILVMVISGALAGLAGGLAALAPTAGGMPVPLSDGIVGTVGFDAIAVALLGRSKPLGIVLAGLLFGALHAGGMTMQSMAQTPLDLTTVLQALIVMFVAAPRLVTDIVPFLRRRMVQSKEVAA